MIKCKNIIRLFFSVVLLMTVPSAFGFKALTYLFSGSKEKEPIATKLVNNSYLFVDTQENINEMVNREIDKLDGDQTFIVNEENQVCGKCGTPLDIDKQENNQKNMKLDKEIFNLADNKGELDKEKWLKGKK